MWGGCIGNKNNFVDYNACMKQCKGHVPAAIIEGGVDVTAELQAKFIPGCVGEYGCCDDGVSPAKGPYQQGCPGMLPQVFLLCFYPNLFPNYFILLL